MSVENLMNHTCSITHMTLNTSLGGYGLPSTSEINYGDTPDIGYQICHFKSGSITPADKGPGKIYNSPPHMDMPVGVDIRFNDKIQNLETQLVYYANPPIALRGNRIRCELRSEL